MQDTPQYNINDIAQSSDYNRLMQMKKDFYAHRSIRNAIDSEYKEKIATLDAKTAGKAAWIQGFVEETIDKLSQESDGISLFLTGSAKFELGAHAEAAICFEKSLATNGPIHGKHLLCECLILSNQFEKGEEILNSLSPDSAETFYCRGVLNETLLNHESAIENYNKCLEKDSHHRYALFRLGQIFNRFGNDDEAIKYYEKCREELPVILAGLINLGIIYEDQMKLQEAVYCFEEILETDPYNAYAKLYLNDVNQSFNMQYDEESERLFDHQNRILKMKICDFELSVRSRNCLERMNIYTIDDLVNKSEAELLSYPNFGETSLQEIKEILSSKGIQLGQKLGQPFLKPGMGGRPGTGDQMDPKLKTSIATLKLSVRSTKVLETLGVMNLGQLIAFTEDQLMAQKNFGSTSIREIKSKLQEYGLELAPKKSKRQSEDASILASMKPNMAPAPAPAPNMPTSSDAARPIGSAIPVETVGSPISIVKPESTPIEQTVVSMSSPEAITSPEVSASEEEPETPVTPVDNNPDVASS